MSLMQVPPSAARATVEARGEQDNEGKNRDADRLAIDIYTHCYLLLEYMVASLMAGYRTLRHAERPGRCPFPEKDRKSSANGENDAIDRYRT